MWSINAFATGGGEAFGVPGLLSVWSYAGKTETGITYEKYANGTIVTTARRGNEWNM